MKKMWKGLITLCAGAGLGFFGARSAHGAVAGVDQGIRFEPKVAGQGQVVAGPDPGFSVTTEPVLIARGRKNEETVEFATDLGSSSEKSLRAMASFLIVDDLGNIVKPRQLSPAVSLAARAKAPAGTLVVPPLADGWYQITTNAVFVDPASREAEGFAQAMNFLHVQGGETLFLDASEWDAASNANLGRREP